MISAARDVLVLVLGGCLRYDSRVERYLQAMVSMVLRSSEGPPFSRMVTGPSAPVQVSSKGLPGSGLMATLVNRTALAAAARAARTTAV